MGNTGEALNGERKRCQSKHVEQVRGEGMWMSGKGKMKSEIGRGNIG